MTTVENGKDILSIPRIAQWVDEMRVPCDCGEILDGANVKYWGPHDGGIQIEEEKEKQWVYINCSGCGYDWALWKIMNRAKEVQAHPEMRDEAEQERQRRAMNKVGGSEGLITFDYPTKCQHPQCKTHPWMKRGYVVEGVPIGKICMKSYGPPTTLGRFK